MLLSSSVAETASLENPTSSHTAANPNVQNLDLAAAPNIVTNYESSHTGMGLSDYLRTGTFTLPLVQWDPANPFPMDISLQVRRAKIQIQGTLNETKPVVLNEIVLSRYFPEGAVSAIKGTMEENRWHWLVTFRYGSTDRDKKIWQSVYMLLDGRLVP
jgi:hypothetical protein